MTENLSADNRELGAEMKAEGWIVMRGDDIWWIHAPSNRCIDMHSALRKQCGVPCWGPEPADPETPGYFVACRVHDENGNPLYGDAFWVESYAVALRMARRIRAAILAETPAQGSDRKREYERRHDEAWRELAALARMNARLTAKAGA
jgi:hypothetical protein